MKNLHYGHCIIGVALAAVLLVAFGVSANTLGFVAVVLVCPLMMFVMMRMMKGNQPGTQERDHSAIDTDRPR